MLKKIKIFNFLLCCNLIAISTALSSENLSAQSQSPPRINQGLVKYIKETIPNEMWNKTKYYFAETDLNNDKKKEIIVYIISPLCGNMNCNIVILQKQGNSYKEVLSGLAIAPKVALLKSKNNGWFDIATESYDFNTQKERWGVWKFNGQTYEVVGRDTKVKSNQIKQIILDSKHHSKINLTD